MDNLKLIKALDETIERPYAWPGGYALLGVMSDGEYMCAKCLKEDRELIVEAIQEDSRSGWALAGIDVYWEGPMLFCCNCNDPIESEYGDPEETGEAA